MRLQSKHTGKSRTKTEFKQIKALPKKKTPTTTIASKMSSKLNAIYKKARAFGISLTKVTKSSKGRKRH